MVLLKISLFIAFLAILAPALLSWYFRGSMAKYDSPNISFDDIPNLKGKVAIVTGSNTGIGLVTCRELARKGARVILTARSEVKGIEAVDKIKKSIESDPGAGSVEFLPLDLSSLKSIKSFVDEFVKSEVSIDYLFLNAGVMMCPFQKTEDGFEQQIGTNHLGHFYLVQLLKNKIIESKSRIVVVSSNAHSLPLFDGKIDFDSFDSNGDSYDPTRAYGQSKLANILFSNELSRRLHGTGATSNSLHPGAINTDLMRHAEASMSDKIKKTLEPITSFIKNALLLSTDDGALTQLYVGTADALQGVTGKYFEPIGKYATPSKHALNETLAKLLWEKSEDLTKTKW